MSIAIAEIFERETRAVAIESWMDLLAWANSTSWGWSQDREKCRERAEQYVAAGVLPPWP